MSNYNTGRGLPIPCCWRYFTERQNTVLHLLTGLKFFSKLPEISKLLSRLWRRDLSFLSLITKSLKLWPWQKKPLRGTWKRAYLPGTLKDEWRGALETQDFSLWELCKGNLKGRFLYWGPRTIRLVRLWKWASVSIEAPFWGTRWHVPFLRTFEKSVKFLFLLGEFYWENLVLISFGLLFDTDYVRNLNLGSNVELLWRARTPWIGIRVWGTKGLF